MIRRQAILLEGGGDGGGGDGGGGGGGAPVGPTMADIIPDSFKDHPSLAAIKTPGDLVQSFVHAQSLVGADKILKPSDKWKDKEWGEFYSQIGRPETPGDYKLSAPPEGISFDEKVLESAKAVMHREGLTNKQADTLIKFYMEDQARVGTEYAAQQEADRANAMESLKREWGPAFDNRMEIALSVVQKFGTEELQTLLADTKWGDNPDFIKFFHNVGEAIMEDKAEGQGSGLMVTSQTQAEQEIKQLKTDQEFLEKLHNDQAPGHKEVVERWRALHARAYPSK